MRGRGLKYLLGIIHSFEDCRPLMRGRGLKCLRFAVPIRCLAGRPLMRGRGLKSLRHLLERGARGSPPHEGAWIEINIDPLTGQIIEGSPPHEGAWIEIPSRYLPP